MSNTDQHILWNWPILIHLLCSITLRHVSKREEKGGLRDFQAPTLLQGATLLFLSPCWSPATHCQPWERRRPMSLCCRLSSVSLGGSGNRVWSQLPPSFLASFLPAPLQGHWAWSKSTDVNRSLIKGVWMRPQGHCLQELFMANWCGFREVPWLWN